MTLSRSTVILSVLLIAIAMTAGCGSSASPAQPTAALAESAAAPTTADPATEIAIEVAPNVLNLQSQGQVVTVHTSLPFGSVEASSISLSGVTINSWKADNQGQFVAKFLMDDIKNLALKIGEYNTLRIEGTTTSGTSFWGSKAILVLNNAAGK